MKGIFRIYRDTRFSKNKAPYKTHVGLVWSRSGRKSDEGALYAHVEPGNCFLGAGFWAPETPLLRRWRERLAADPAGWLAAIAEVEGAGLAVEGRDSLKRMPRGYESFAESDVAEALRWKGAVAMQRVADADVAEARLRRPDPRLRAPGASASRVGLGRRGGLKRCAAAAGTPSRAGYVLRRTSRPPRCAACFPSSSPCLSPAAHATRARWRPRR